MFRLVGKEMNGVAMTKPDRSVNLFGAVESAKPSAMPPSAMPHGRRPYSPPQLSCSSGKERTLKSFHPTEGTGFTIIHHSIGPVGPS